MSRYTTQVRYILESLLEHEEPKPFNEVEEIIDKTWERIFNFDFPLFDPNYKKHLCQKILLEYYMEEIGQETVGLWKLTLRQKLNKIMPYYNQLYKSELLTFEIFDDVNIEKEYTKTNDGNENISESSDSNETLNYDSTGNSNTTKFNSSDGKIETDKSIDNRFSENSEKNNDETNNGEYNSNLKQKGKDISETKTENGETVNATLLFSDTPQGRISNLNENGYLTDARNNKTQTESKGQTNLTSDTDNQTDIIDKTKNTNIGKETFRNNSSNDTDEITSTTTENSSNGNENTATSKIDNSIQNTFSSKVGNKTNEIFETYYEKIKGKNGGTNSKRLIEFRETFLNIDAMILDDLQDLFMGLWG